MQWDKNSKQTKSQENIIVMVDTSGSMSDDNVSHYILRLG